MAKYSNGFMGPFSGKLGPAVGYTWNGKWCMWSYQKYVKNPRTEAQQAHRAMFKQEVQLAARMRQVIARTMTDPARELGMTAYNLFVKANQDSFFEVRSSESGVRSCDLGVDYANLVLSFGDIAPVEAEEVERTVDNVLNVRFARGIGRGNDEVYLYVWVPDLQRGYMSSSVHRREKRLSVALPDEYAGHEVQAWLLVQGEEGGWSQSTFVDCSEQCSVFSVQLDADAACVPLAVEDGRGVSRSGAEELVEGHAPVAPAADDSFVSSKISRKLCSSQ